MKTKKIRILLFLSVLIILTLPLHAFALTASLPDVSAEPGATISIPLTVNDVSDLQAIDVTINFDEPVLDATGATLVGGVLEAENYDIQYNTGPDGEIIFTIYATGELFTGSGVFAYLQFDVVGNGDDYTDLQFTQFDINENSYLYNTTDGSVTISEPSGSLPDTSVVPDTSLSIPLTVNDVNDLQAIDVTINFDEPVLDATGATLVGGVLEAENYDIQYNTGPDGEIIFTIYATGELFTGSGVFAYLQFDVVGSDGDYTDLQFTQFDVNENSYLGNTTDGSVTVEDVGPDPSASLPDETANPGASISIPLTVNQMTDLEAIDLTITFDEPVIDATGAVLTGGVLEDDYNIEDNTNIDGEIQVTIYCTDTLYSGSGVVSYLEFDVVGSDGDYSDLHFTQFDVNETSYLGNTTDGSVTVEGEGPGWTVNPAAYEYTGIVKAGVFDGGVQIGAEEDSVAAFCGGECRGVSGGSIYTPVGEVVFEFPVYSNETSGDWLTFKYWDASEDNVYLVNDAANVEFIPDMVLGSLDPYDPYVLSIDTAIDNPGSQQNISLKQNYPNPFNANTNIYYSIKKPSNVKIEVYNLKGQLVETLVDEHETAGDYEVKWNAENQNNGVYLYKIITDDRMKSKKMILMK